MICRSGFNSHEEITTANDTSVNFINTSLEPKPPISAIIPRLNEADELPPGDTAINGHFVLCDAPNLLQLGEGSQILPRGRD